MKKNNEVTEEYMKYINGLYCKIDIEKSRYRFWRTIATVSLTINGFIFGLTLGIAIFR